MEQKQIIAINPIAYSSCPMVSVVPDLMYILYIVCTYCSLFNENYWKRMALLLPKVTKFIPKYELSISILNKNI